MPLNGRHYLLVLVFALAAYCPGVAIDAHAEVSAERTDGALEQSSAQLWRRATESGAIETVEAPPAPDWGVEIWPQRLSEEMMTARPTREQVLRAHPPRALQRERIGAVVLEGRVMADGALVWRIVNAYPEGWGFEDAAIRVAGAYRAPLQFEDGRSTLGATFLTVIAFTRPPRRPYIQY